MPSPSYIHLLSIMRNPGSGAACCSTPLKMFDYGADTFAGPGSRCLIASTSIKRFALWRAGGGHDALLPSGGWASGDALQPARCAYAQ